MNESNQSLAITFQAIFSKLASTVDGGWNLTLSLAQEEAAQAMQLATLRDYVLQVAIVPSEANYG